MPKLKSLLIFFIMISIILLLTGCSMLFSRGSDPERETAASEAGMPSWLLLSHRSIDDPDGVDNGNQPGSPGNEETDQQDLTINVDPPEPSTGSPPAAAQPSADSSTPEQTKSGNDIKPGTMEWIAEIKKQEKEAQAAMEKEKAAKEAAEEEEEEEEEEKDEAEENKWYDLNNDKDSDITHDINITTD